MSAVYTLPLQGLSDKSRPETKYTQTQNAQVLWTFCTLGLQQSIAVYLRIAVFKEGTNPESSVEMDACQPDWRRGISSSEPPQWMDHGVALVPSNRKQKQGLRRKIFFFSSFVNIFLKRSYQMIHFGGKKKPNLWGMYPYYRAENGGKVTCLKYHS